MNRRAVSCGGESASSAKADAMKEKPHSVAAMTPRTMLSGESENVGPRT